MKASFRVALVMLFLLTPLTAFAQDGFYVISVPAKPLKNVVTVSLAKGKFIDPVAAVASIMDASASNPYLVVIGPGIYTVTSPVVMKPYVDIAGSGENVTKITGAISTATRDSSAVISGSSNSTLRSLTVENTGGSSYSIALYNPPLAVTMVSDVTATARGGGSNYGIYNNSSSPVLTNVTAIASGGASYGVYNFGSSSPVLINMTATSSGGAGYGVYNYGNASPVIRRSTIKGSIDSLRIEYGTVTVSQSTIIGGVSGSGAKTCVACDNGSGVALGADCLVP